MSQTAALIPRPARDLELYQPLPRIAYTLEATVRLTGVPRHTIIVYCKRGLVTTAMYADHAGWRFDDRAIHIIRRIQDLRATHGIGLAGLGLILGLSDEITRLRRELTHLRVEAQGHNSTNFSGS